MKIPNKNSRYVEFIICTHPRILPNPDLPSITHLPDNLVLDRGKGDTRAFHTIDPLVDFLGILHETSIVIPIRYLVLITLPHKEELWVNLHRLISTKYWLNRFTFCKPHPPTSFVDATLSHFTIGMEYDWRFLDYRNLKLSFMILEIISSITHVIDVQYA